MQPLFGLWSDAAAPSGCCRSGSLSPGSGSGSRPSPRATALAARARLRLGHRHRGVPPGGGQARRLRQRPQARERDVALQHRRQHRATRSARSSSRRSSSGSGSAPEGCSPRSRCSLCVGARARRLPYLSRRQPGPGSGLAQAEGEDDVRAMVVLGGVIGLRSVAWFGLLTFVPLWASRSASPRRTETGCSR